VGDLVLKARRHRGGANVLRDVDLVARYGGEEFVVIAVHSDRKGACIVNAPAPEKRGGAADRRERAETGGDGQFGTGDCRRLRVASDPDQMIADADAQLYLSKKAGRNTWSYLGRSASQLTGAPSVKAAVCA